MKNDEILIVCGGYTFILCLLLLISNSVLGTSITIETLSISGFIIMIIGLLWRGLNKGGD